MKAVVRNNTIKKEKEVCFLLDEFFSLGYLAIIETALAQYRGFGVHVLPVLQDLTQLQTHYKSWETFIANCNLKLFFNINDEFTAEYVSKLLGTESVVSHDKKGAVSGSTARRLMNPDEVRSSEAIISFIGTLKPTLIWGAPYYDGTFKLREGVDYDPNPYITKNAGQLT